VEPTISDPWGDRFSEAERALLAPFVTDVDAPVFGLRNLPDVVRDVFCSMSSFRRRKPIFRRLWRSAPMPQHIKSSLFIGQRRFMSAS
jgi:hypothetical protein